MLREIEKNSSDNMLLRFILKSSEKTEEIIKFVNETSGIVYSEKLKNNDLLFVVNYDDENFEGVPYIENKLQELFPPNADYSLDFVTTNRGNKDYSIFGHSDSKKTNNYRIENEILDRIENRKNGEPIEQKILYAASAFQWHYSKAVLFEKLTEMEKEPLENGAYLRYLIKFNEDISENDLDVIATEIKNFENARYIEKINKDSIFFIMYIADPFYGKKDKKDKKFKTKIDSYYIALSNYCRNFEEDLYNCIVNYYKKGHSVNYVTTNLGSFDALVSGYYIDDGDDDCGYGDIQGNMRVCFAKNLYNDEIYDSESESYKWHYNYIMKH